MRTFDAFVARFNQERPHQALAMRVAADVYARSPRVYRGLDLGHLDQQMADLLAAHQAAVQRLAEVPGLGADSAQQIIAEVGATAATFPSPKH